MRSCLISNRQLSVPGAQWTAAPSKYLLDESSTGGNPAALATLDQIVTDYS